ncbi:hypothetical protein G6F68_011615 [Rhizopus microsporus]|nr:hypothetical protein G6F68_011615 [Rhizopus microsporus]
MRALFSTLPADPSTQADGDTCAGLILASTRHQAPQPSPIASSRATTQALARWLGAAGGSEGAMALLANGGLHAAAPGVGAHDGRVVPQALGVRPLRVGRLEHLPDQHLRLVLLEGGRLQVLQQHDPVPDVAGLPVHGNRPVQHVGQLLRKAEIRLHHAVTGDMHGSGRIVQKALVLGLAAHGKCLAAGLLALVRRQEQFGQIAIAAFIDHAAQRHAGAGLARQCLHVLLDALRQGFRRGIGGGLRPVLIGAVEDVLAAVLHALEHGLVVEGRHAGLLELNRVLSGSTSTSS